MTWVDVVDSAIKIGLGALIGGAFSVVALRLSHAHERDKEFRSHRIKTIEKVADLVEEFFTNHSKVVSRIAWLVEQHGGQRLKVDATMEESLRERDAELLKGADGMRIAASRLQLLAADECLASAKEVTTIVMNFRNGYALNREFPSSKEIELYVEKVNALRGDALKKLAEVYRNS